MYIGAIEAGGTKFVCAVSDKDLKFIDKVSIATSTPEETLGEAFKFFDQYSLLSLGVGSFGPIDLNKHSDTYGYITSTPKLDWENFNFVGVLKERYNVPVVWTTDVNAAAYGEFKKGSAIETGSCLYLTIGTGIGGGAIVNGGILSGLSHPEMGHITVRQHEKDMYKGNCPYHMNCLEGLASGPAIEKRFNKKGIELSNEKFVWKLEAYYIAQALMTYTLTLSPEKIILGGGVMNQNQLFDLVREQLTELMKDYLKLPKMDEYIVPPKLGNDAGITGCLFLAKEKVEMTQAIQA